MTFAMCLGAPFRRSVRTRKTEVRTPKKGASQPMAAMPPSKIPVRGAYRPINSSISATVTGMRLLPPSMRRPPSVIRISSSIRTPPKSK